MNEKRTALPLVVVPGALLYRHRPDFGARVDEWMLIVALQHGCWIWCLVSPVDGSAPPRFERVGVADPEGALRSMVLA